MFWSRISNYVPRVTIWGNWIDRKGETTNDAKPCHLILWRSNSNETEISYLQWGHSTKLVWSTFPQQIARTPLSK